MSATGILGLCWCSLFIGCGYHFSVKQGKLSDGSQSLSIPIIQNQTVEGWTTTILTQQLRENALANGLRLMEKGTPRLQAHLVSIKATPRSVATQGGLFQTKEQQVAVRLHMELKLRNGTKHSFALFDKESYLSTSDIRGTQANRQVAVEGLLAKLAQRAVERISRNF